MLVKDVMITDSYLLYEEDTILHASKLMKQERVRNLPVVDKEKKLVGLITLREIIEILLKNPQKILVRDAMIKLVSTCEVNMTLKEAIEIMLQNKYGCLPVIDKNKNFLGIVSEATLLKTLHELSNMKSSLSKVQ